jgi:hypothetical protein
MAVAAAEAAEAAAAAAGEAAAAAAAAGAAAACPGEAASSARVEQFPIYVDGLSAGATALPTTAALTRLRTSRHLLLC